MKLNEYRLLKFNQVKQLKENSTENSAEKNFKKIRNLMNSKTFLQNKKKKKKKKERKKKKKKKKKRKILKFKELCFPDTLSDQFQQFVLKICNTLSFLSLSFSFLLYKIHSLLKTLLSALSFWISIRTRKLLNLLFKLTVWNYRLILHTKVLWNFTQLNIKLDFSVTHFTFIQNFIPQIPLYCDDTPHAPTHFTSLF